MSPAERVTGAQVIAAVRELAAERNRLRALAGRLAGVVCEMADAVDAADANGGELTLSDEVLRDLRAIRDEVWSATVAGANPEDFVTT